MARHSVVVCSTVSENVSIYYLHLLVLHGSKRKILDQTLKETGDIRGFLCTPFCVFFVVQKGLRKSEGSTSILLSNIYIYLDILGIEPSRLSG